MRVVRIQAEEAKNVMVKFELDATWARDLAYHWLAALLFFFMFALSPPIALRLRQGLYRYCDGPDCRVVVEELRRSLDIHTKPCDNFYRFVCGRWALTNAPFADLATQNRLRFRRRLGEAMLGVDTRRRGQGAIEKAARLYSVCRYQIFDDGCHLKAVVSILAEIDITWPFSKEQAGTLGNVSVITALTKLRIWHGIDLVYAGGVAAGGVKLGRKLLLRIGALLPHPQPVLNTTQLSSAVANLALMLGSADVDYALLAQMVQSQEETLAAYINATKLQPDEDTVLTFGKAKSTFPGYNWTLFNEVVTTELDYKLADKDHIAVNNRTLMAVTGVLQDGAAMHAFLGWRLVRQLAPMACGRAGLALAQAVGGDVDVVSDLLTTDAVDRLQEHMPMAVAAPYIHQEQPGESREDLQRYVALLMQSLRDGLVNSAYLSTSFRKTTAKLMRRLKSHVLYPDFVHLDVQVDRLYRHIPDFEGDCLNMTLVLLREGTWNRYQRLGSAAALYGEGWHLPQIATEPSFVLEADALFVPLGAAAAPLYAAGAPALWQLGALGSVLGRQVVGRLLTLASAWHQFTPPKAQCFSNASLAQAYALRRAHFAFYVSIAQGVMGLEKQRLRGLERFREDQLLFVASCFSLCSSDQEATGAEAVCNDAARNSHNFAVVFRCPEGSAMNPKNKCDL